MAIKEWLDSENTELIDEQISNVDEEYDEDNDEEDLEEEFDESTTRKPRVRRTLNTYSSNSYDSGSGFGFFGIVFGFVGLVIAGMIGWQVLKIVTESIDIETTTNTITSTSSFSEVFSLMGGQINIFFGIFMVITSLIVLRFVYRTFRRNLF